MVAGNRAWSAASGQPPRGLCKKSQRRAEGPSRVACETAARTHRSSRGRAEDIRSVARNNAGRSANHTMFRQIMGQRGRACHRGRGAISAPLHKCRRTSTRPRRGLRLRLGDAACRSSGQAYPRFASEPGFATYEWKAVLSGNNGLRARLLSQYKKRRPNISLLPDGPPGSASATRRRKQER
jgi:hypothetical protein